MKKITKYIIGLSAVMALITSCKEEDQPISGFSLDKEEITFTNPNGETALIQIATDAEWQASTEAAWLQLAPGNGNGSATMEVKADSSVLASLRETNIRFMAKGLGMKTVKVKQFGYAKEISLEQNEVKVKNNAPYEERFFEVTLTANVNFKVEIEYPEEVQKWIEFDEEQKIDLDYGERPRTGKLRFDWTVNTNEVVRNAVIKFVPENTKENEGAKTVTLKVTQESAPILTDDRAGDSLAVLAIYQSMNGIFAWDATEKMDHWTNVKLWRASDKIDGKKIPSDMVGRVRSASFVAFDTKESIPYQVTQLRYAESLSFYGNANREIKKIELGSDICTLLKGHPENNGKSYLKQLEIASYGLTKLPADFESKTLESLDLSSNNFVDSEWLKQINAGKFSGLKALGLTNMRTKSVANDLKAEDLGFRWETGFGIHNPYGTSNNRDAFIEFLRWEKLEKLSLSVGLLEGELPTDEELQQKGFNAYVENDFAALGDTISPQGKNLLITNKVTKVLPNMKALSLNLNFLTGKLPGWLLYHPNLDFWNPYSLIFSQEIKAKNSKGEAVGFVGGEPRSLGDYSNLTEALGYPAWMSQKGNSYYEVYPGRAPKKD